MSNPGPPTAHHRPDIQASRTVEAIVAVVVLLTLMMATVYLIAGAY